LYDNLYALGWDVNEPKAAARANWKHAYPWPEVTDLLACQGVDRILYIFNEPVAALASMFRRGYGLLKVAPWEQSRSKKLWARNFTAYVDIAASQRRDIFGRHQHLQAWLAAPLPCPALYVDFSTLLANLDILADFLSVPVAALAGLQLRQRHTEDPHAVLPATYLELYQSVYAQMQVFDLTVRLPADYADPPSLAAGLLHPIRPPPKQSRDVNAQDMPRPAAPDAANTSRLPPQ
jgi:hypothetical protein